MKPMALDTRGVILTRLGRLDEAIEELEGGRGRGPPPSAIFHLAMACRNAGSCRGFRRNLGQARPRADFAAQGRPRRPSRAGIVDVALNRTSPANEETRGGGRPGLRQLGVVGRRLRRRNRPGRSYGEGRPNPPPPDGRGGTGWHPANNSRRRNFGPSLWLIGRKPCWRPPDVVAYIMTKDLACHLA